MKQPSRVRTSLKLVATGILVCAGLSRCALFGGGEETPTKAGNIKVMEPSQPYKKLDTGNADYAWQSTRTGNTISVNSSCKKTDENLKALEAGVLSGIEHMDVKSTVDLNLDSAPAQRLHVIGKTEGVTIEIDLVVLRKSDCTYDLAYVARQKTFREEREYFNKFLEGFHAP